MRKLILTSLVLLLLPTLVVAQTTGSISGKVTGEDGAPVSGATVTATSLSTGLERVATTDRNGNYLIGLLPVGNWSVVITAAGLQPQATSFRIGVGQKIPVDATLLPGDFVAEELNVYATSTALQTIGTQENINYREEVEQLPVENRNINVVARLAGHVSDATQTGVALTIAGAPSYDTVVLLDGAEISDPFFGTGTTVYLEDAIEEVQVLTSGISARYGRFQGGVINAITKSGSNNFEATLRYEFDQESWNEKTPFDEDQSDTLNEVYQLTGGGYFLRDRAWFFGGYREIPVTSSARTTGFTNESFENTSTEERWQIKLRGAPAPNHLIDVSRLEFDGSTDPWSATNLNPGHLQALTGTRGDPRETETIAYQGVLSSNLFLELQGTTKDAAIFAGGDPNGGSPFIDWNTFDVFNNYWWDASDLSLRNNETMSANVTYSLATASAGTHTIEAGVQTVDSETGGENKQTPTLYNLIGFNPDFIAGADASGQPLFNLRNGVTQRWTAIPLGGAQFLENTGVYVQDTINLGDWRFDVGVRYDEYQGAGALVFHNLNFDKIVPRLGVSYNIAEDWQVTGGWGQYTSRFNDNYSQGAARVGTAPRINHAFTGVDGPQYENLTAAEADALLSNDALWTRITGFSGPGLYNEYLADNINAPYAEEMTLSLRRQLPNNSGTVVLSYVRRDYKDLLSSFVGGVCDFSNIFSFDHETESCADGGANTTDIRDAAGNVTGEVDTTVWANDPRNQRNYSGISLQVNYRPTSRWNVGGNYTFSETQGNYEGEGQNTPAGGGALGSYNRTKPLGNAAPYGFVDEDLRHRLRAFGSYRLDFGRAGNLALSGVVSMQSGTRYSLTAQAPYGDFDGYVSQPGTYGHFFDGRGRNRFNNFNRFDFAARYDIDIAGKFGIWVKATIINALNDDQLLAFQTNGSAVMQNGILTFQPVGNCGLNDAPSVDCTGFGRISDQTFYQRPREYFFTVGLRY